MTTIRQAAVVLALLIAGCARHGSVVRPYPPPAADALVAALRARQAAVPGMSARVRATSWLSGERVRATVNMLVERDGRLRFEAEVSLQGTVATLATDGGVFALLDARKNELSRGPACPANVASLIRIPLAPADVAAILLGDARPPAETGAAPTVDWDSSGGADILSLPDPAGGALQISFRGTGAERRLVGASRVGGNGARLWRTSYDDFEHHPFRGGSGQLRRRRGDPVPRSCGRNRRARRGVHPGAPAGRDRARRRLRWLIFGSRGPSTRSFLSRPGRANQFFEHRGAAGRRVARFGASRALARHLLFQPDVEDFQMTRAILLLPALLVLACGSSLTPEQTPPASQSDHQLAAARVADPCGSFTTADACKGAGAACSWTAVTCPANADCPAAVCATVDPCATYGDAKTCAADSRCAWTTLAGTANAPALCPVGHDCTAKGYCWQAPASGSGGGSGCGCVQPLACPKDGACPAVACDCPPPPVHDGGGSSTGGGTCTCACPACAPGEACPPCKCDCGTGGGGGDIGSGGAGGGGGAGGSCGSSTGAGNATGSGTCTCACPTCPPGSACAPCSCSCGAGSTTTMTVSSGTSGAGNASGSAAAGTGSTPTGQTTGAPAVCACPACPAGTNCAPCDCTEPPNPCTAFTDAKSCAADKADTCAWIELQIACFTTPCPTGQCVRMSPPADGGGGSTGSGGCGCACPACTAGASCPPCKCDCCPAPVPASGTTASPGIGAAPAPQPVTANRP